MYLLNHPYLNHNNNLKQRIVVPIKKPISIHGSRFIIKEDINKTNNKVIRIKK